MESIPPSNGSRLKQRLHLPKALKSVETIIAVLLPLMIFEVVMMGIGGLRRFGTFDGAILLMAALLGLIWICVGGATMYLARDAIRERVRAIAWSEGIKFILFATVLALVEEAVTSTLTNLASELGSADAFITASRNYLEVVIWHSVVVIVPMFFVWAWVLARYRFRAEEVFLLFGCNGVLAELLIGGPALLMAPFWIFVYGLMIFLPAYCFQAAPRAWMPRWFAYPLCVLGCLLASAATALLVNALSPHLPHFGKTLSFPK